MLSPRWKAVLFSASGIFPAPDKVRLWPHVPHLPGYTHANILQSLGRHVCGSCESLRGLSTMFLKAWSHQIAQSTPSPCAFNLACNFALKSLQPTVWLDKLRGVASSALGLSDVHRACRPSRVLRPSGLRRFTRCHESRFCDFFRLYIYIHIYIYALLYIYIYLLIHLCILYIYIYI